MDSGGVVARACPMFKNKNKFLEKRGQLFKKLRFLFPLVCLPHLRLMHLGLTAVSSHLLVFVVVVTGDNGNGEFLFFFSFCFCNTSLFLYIWKDCENKKAHKTKRSCMMSFMDINVLSYCWLISFFNF